MDMASQSKASINKKLAFVALGISLIGQTVSPCLAVSLTKSSQKRATLQYEVYSKLSPGAGPQTNDLQKQDPQLDNSTPAEPGAAAATAPAATAAKPVDLTPVTLDEGQKADTSLGPAEEGVFKATVKLDRAAVSGPVDQSAILAPKSINASVNDKVLSGGRGISNMAKQVNAMPIPLMQSAEEEQNSGDVKFNAEKIELADLWDATLARSQDIQFVVQKLMPSSNSGKTANVMMKMLSATVFGGMSMMTMMAPNMGAQMGANMGGSLMMQALNGVQGAQDKKARLSQTEAIMLYQMVRSTADKVVSAYKDDKINLSGLEKTSENLKKLQAICNEVRGSQTPVQQIQMEAELMKYQTNADMQADQVNRYRQALIDLSGPDAVAKLDKQLQEDKERINDSSIINASADQKISAPDGTQVAPTNGAVPN
jgi:hypothetical protein